MMSRRQSEEWFQDHVLDYKYYLVAKNGFPVLNSLYAPASPFNQAAACLRPKSNKKGCRKKREKESVNLEIIEAIKNK
jgi:hypothetical protein